MGARVRMRQAPTWFWLKWTYHVRETEKQERFPQHSTCPSWPSTNLSQQPKLWPTDPPPKSWAMMGWWESGGCGRSRRVTPPYLGQWSWVTSLTGQIYVSQRCYQFFPFSDYKNMLLVYALMMTSASHIARFQGLGKQSDWKKCSSFILTCHTQTAACASYVTFKGSFHQVKG